MRRPTGSPSQRRHSAGRDADRLRRRTVMTVALSLVLAGPSVEPLLAQAAGGAYEFHDSHFHLTNYIQEGRDVTDLLDLMGARVGRSTLFGIPLQQTWSYENSGDYAPTYYLHSDAPLYYYSFTDAWIASQYLKLPPEEQARLDPMITGFNPADMYGVDHIRRVLQTFPGVFTGIGEFSIHKEFVSSKVAGEVASLTDPALSRILSFAEETGLVVILHNDLDMPFAAANTEPVYLRQLVAVLRNHPGTPIIWAHLGLGRIVHPVQSSPSAPAAERVPNQAEIVEGILSDPSLSNVHFDISWDELAKYILATPETTRRAADVINRHPDRFLFGSDVVAPRDEEAYFGVYEMYAPLLELLTPEARSLLLRGNYERLFDEGRRRVRAWESANVAGSFY